MWNKIFKNWALTTLLAGPASLAQGGNDDAAAIAAKIEKMLSPEQASTRYSFTNVRVDGTKTEYEVRFEIKDINHSRGSFEKPEREKGREVLRLDDDMWTFVPSVGRVVRIADRDSFAGGDFSNADILRVDWSRQYQVKIIKSLPTQWVLEFEAKSQGASYAKMRLWVDKKSGQPVQQQYFDSKGTMLKRSLYGESTRFGDLERPARIVMENLITRQRSELRVLELSQGKKLLDSRFVVDNLGK